MWLPRSLIAIEEGDRGLLKLNTALQFLKDKESSDLPFTTDAIGKGAAFDKTSLEGGEKWKGLRGGKRGGLGQHKGQHGGRS